MGDGIFLVAVLKYAEPLEAHVAHEIAQVLKFRFGLPGEADQHRGAQLNARHTPPGFGHQRARIRLRHLPPHPV